MGLWSGIFKKKRYQEEPAEDWDNLVCVRDDVDFSEEEQRRGYIANCLEQVAEATYELNLLKGEYSLVTSHLTDIEEIEALPREEKDALSSIAARLAAMEQERQRYQGKKNRMSDEDYYRIRKQEDEVQDGISKLHECEDYGGKIRQDLQRLDRERSAYEFRRQELDSFLNNLRGMAMIFLTAFCLCMGMLLILHFVFEMDTQIGYLLAVGAVAVAAMVVWLKYTEGEKELHRVEVSANKLIALQNKVKIRYVNNKSLTNYLHIKYNTESVAALEKLWRQYQEEREERKEFAQAQAKAEYYQQQLLARLSNYRISAPGRWAMQPAALLDKREMVEMRHELILRRQKLREQMDYNSNIADTARKEIIDVAEKYPAYASEIMKMVEEYKSEAEESVL